MATMIGQQSSSVMTQHFSRERHHHNEGLEIMSPDGDLRDVEADFQSLVNEMVQDGGKRPQQGTSASTYSQITAKSATSSFSSSGAGAKSSTSSFSSSTSGRTPSSIPVKKGPAPFRPNAPPKLNIPPPQIDYVRPNAPPKLNIPPPQIDSDAVVSVTIPARTHTDARNVVPDSMHSASSEVIIEQQMRVKDRIKRLEKQLSEDSEPTQPPEVIIPKSKLGTIRNIADQFELVDDSSPTPRVNTSTVLGDEYAERSVKEIASTFSSQSEETMSSQRVMDDEVEFKNVKEVASSFNEPFSPVTIKPPAPFSDSDVPEAVSPVPVLPPAMRKPPTPPVEPSLAAVKSYNQTSVSWKNEDDANYLEKRSQVSTESSSMTSADTVIQQPMQYSAQVRCEVKSRVETPEVPESKVTSSSKTIRSETRSSASAKTASSTSGAQKSSSKSTFGAVAPTPLARTTANTPRTEIKDATLPKFSLLRSASAGSVGETLQAGMVRTRSDKDIPKFNIKKVKAATTYGSKVWTPGAGTPDTKDGPSKIEVNDLPSFKDVAPVWTPGRAGSASPSLGKKEYNKIRFDGSTSLQRKTSQEKVSAPRPEESFAWQDREAEKLKNSPFVSSSTLPRVQSPTVTLLQKRRDGTLGGSRPDYLPPEETYYKPGDKLYTIKREYESEDEEYGQRKFAVLGPKKIEGVGPTTRDGIPIALKSGVKSEHQGEWYKRMFDSLHKVKDDSLSSKYRQPKARYGGGYMSEPDGYDSDIGSSRYVSLDRRNKRFDFDTSDQSPKNTKRYVHQPGRIENYVPGFSTLSEKELRDNPEADVKLEIKTKGPAPTPSFQSIQRPGSGRMQMSHALKESGYESDSTLVFRKREDQRRQYLNPKDSSVAYKQVQLGGEIPLTGLQKPAPPRPKGSDHKYNSSEVNIHYRTPVRFEQKESLSEEELSRRQEEHMKKVYEQERRKKYLSELEDIERRRHTDNFTPLQKSPIPLNRYDDESLGPLAKTPEPKQLARALFSFSAQNKRELSFNKGDIVTIRRAIDRNWHEGEMKGVVGIFPCNYVEVISLDTLKSLGRKSSEGQARARFNFQAQTGMEMTLAKGELVILTRRVDENWYEGRVGNRKGIFPVTYVDVLMEPGGDRATSPSRDPIPRPALPAAHLLYNGTSGVSSPYSSMGRTGTQTDTKSFTQLTVNTQQDPIPYRALYNYKPQNEDELELIEGDIVLVMEKCDDGWFVGTSKRTGLFGTFPGNYVERS